MEAPSPAKLSGVWILRVTVRLPGTNMEVDGMAHTIFLSKQGGFHSTSI